MPFVRSVQLLADEVPDAALSRWSMPAVRALRTPLELDERATILVGENGSGASPIVEALAVAPGMNPDGGSNRIRGRGARARSASLHEQSHGEPFPSLVFERFGPKRARPSHARVPGGAVNLPAPPAEPIRGVT
jgi:predicted ATPase